MVPAGPRKYAPRSPPQRLRPTREQVIENLRRQRRFQRLTYASRMALRLSKLLLVAALAAAPGHARATTTVLVHIVPSCTAGAAGARALEVCVTATPAPAPPRRRP